MSKKSLSIINESATNNSATQTDQQADFNPGRRNFLKILGVGGAATAIGCADSAKQKIFPHVKGNEHEVPGVSVWYSSTCKECNAGCGTLVRTREGRAVKIEGNPENPINNGGLCAMGQSALQHHYDPDRIREPLQRNASGKFEPISWDAALKKVSEALGKKESKNALITGATNATQARLLKAWCKAFDCDHVEYEAFAPVDLAEAARIVYGRRGVPGFKFENADLIVSFGADFLETWVSPVEYARGWAKGRKQKIPAKFIHIEPRLSLTGANADLWLASKAGGELAIAQSILATLVQKGKGLELGDAALRAVTNICAGMDAPTAASISGVKAEKILLVTDMLARSNAPLVVAGGTAGATSAAKTLQVVTQLINLVLGAPGKTVDLINVRAVNTDLRKFSKLTEQLESDESINILFTYNTNPAFSLPSAKRFNYAARRSNLVVSFASHLDETAELADLILPTHSSLEAWGDNESLSGIKSLIQPVMTPVFNTRQFEDLLLNLAKDKSGVLDGAESYKDYLQKSWQTVYSQASNKPASFEKFWLESVERGGFFEATATVPFTASLNTAALKGLELYSEISSAKLKRDQLVLLPYASVRAFDGRAANRPWLQELPDPVTKIVWGSWVELNPKTAKKLGVKQGDMVRLSNKNGEVNAPAYITDYVKYGVVAVPIGNGHNAYGRYASQIQGGNVLQMLPDQLLSNRDTSSGVQFVSTVVTARKGRGHESLVVTQGSNSQMDRHLARTKVLGAEDDHHGHHGHHGHGEPQQMYLQRPHPIHKWGMAVDLAACTGCSACVVACYAENNIPVVGKKVFDQGREMSWLRIERYYEGSAEELQVSFLPMTCQHCGNAPCEPVCPVYATYHTEEGLNAMVYNRCVGTRYCGNNCSYKVRRFNWFEFDWPEPLNWQLNPDVTKRTAGIMEKCTFCVQRINEGKDRAKDEGRLVRDGEIKPACVQSCPTEALVFGDLNDPNSKVAKLSHDKRAYKVLDDHLNTQPAISYLENVKHKI